MLRTSIAILGVSLVLTVLVIRAEVAWGFRLLLLLPFFLSATWMLQAFHKT